jgi:hypothetical protein
MIHKQWDNRVRSFKSPDRRYHTWTRRVRMYIESDKVILKFEDADGTARKVYVGNDRETAAETDFHSFKEGKLNTLQLRGAY